MRITRRGGLVTRAAPQNRTGATSTSRPDAPRRRALTRVDRHRHGGVEFDPGIAERDDPLDLAR